MDLGRLRLFLQIIDSGSMSAAARAVHLTQPALSRTLAQLEGELGTALFDRRGRGLVLTAAGRALEPKARTLLDEAERVAREVSRAAERDYADLWLGTIDSAATYLMPELVPTLYTTYPGLAVRFHTARSGALLEKIRKAELDLAIVAHSGPPAGVRAESIARYELQYFGRKDLFPTLAKVRTAAELLDFPIVEIEPGHGEPGMRPKDGLSYALASNVHACKSLMLSGFGVGDVPAFVLTPAERQRLVAARVAHDPNCHLYLVAAAHFLGKTPDAMRATILKRLKSIVSSAGSKKGA